MVRQWNNKAFHEAWSYLKKAEQAETRDAKKNHERAATLWFWSACGMNDYDLGMDGQAVGAAFRPLGGE